MIFASSEPGIWLSVLQNKEEGGAGGGGIWQIYVIMSAGAGPVIWLLMMGRVRDGPTLLPIDRNMYISPCPACRHHRKKLFPDMPQSYMYITYRCIYITSGFRLRYAPVRSAHPAFWVNYKALCAPLAIATQHIYIIAFQCDLWYMYKENIRDKCQFWKIPEPIKQR